MWCPESMQWPRTLAAHSRQIISGSPCNCSKPSCNDHSTSSGISILRPAARSASSSVGSQARRLSIAVADSPDRIGLRRSCRGRGRRPKTRRFRGHPSEQGGREPLRASMPALSPPRALARVRRHTHEGAAPQHGSPAQLASARSDARSRPYAGGHAGGALSARARRAARELLPRRHQCPQSRNSRTAHHHSPRRTTQRAPGSGTVPRPAPQLLSSVLAASRGHPVSPVRMVFALKRDSVSTSAKLPCAAQTGSLSIR